MTQSRKKLFSLLTMHLEEIYREVPLTIGYHELAESLITAMRLDIHSQSPQTHQNHWDESDIAIITYGDSLKEKSKVPLKTLHHFLQHHCDSLLKMVHILPFFPYSSDDGFSIIDYSTVGEQLGNWEDIEGISADYRLMADLVINHCSSRGIWFENFKKRVDPGKDYFFTASPDDDLSQVVRPRKSSLLHEVDTLDGKRHVWCTFSHDQVDFDFRNPKVLLSFIEIIRLYLDKGVRVFRLDAVAFLWKKIGTSCINLAETHEMVRLLRTLIEYAQPDAVIITETNIPNKENLAYFGNANEAHSIYNFSLPPLLVNTLLTGDGTYLKQWMMSMPPAQNGTTYFNFIASHDGIGLRPAEGLLSDQEIDSFVETLRGFGAKVSMRDLGNGSLRPYEINISLFDAMQGTTQGKDQLGIERFLCAHGIMLALEGIPAFYIHSLLATQNDNEKVELSGHNRAINRHQWDYPTLESLLNDPTSHHAVVFSKLKTLIALRQQQPAFHPNATQFTLHLPPQLFGFWRQSMDRRQSIFCIYNISTQDIELPLSQINLISTDDWFDLISQQPLPELDTAIRLTPYQIMWITNQLPESG